MYTITEREVGGYQEQPVTYRHFKVSEQNNKIAFLFPGLGYKAEMPLFYYSTNLLLEAGYDVVQLLYHYEHKAAFKEMGPEEREEWICADVDRCISDVLLEENYNDYILIGKSLGTIAMSYELQLRPEFQHARAIWFTPLLKDQGVMERMKTCNQESLCIIGDQDHHYQLDLIKKLEGNASFQITIVPGSDHSLAIHGDTMSSIERLKGVMRGTEHFINQTKNIHLS